MALAVILVAIVLLASAGSDAQRRVVTLMLIDVVLVIGLYIFVGNSGVLSFGHISFMAIGAYTSALLTIPTEAKRVLLPDLPGFLSGAHWPTVAAAIVGGLLAALFALVVSVPLMRLSGMGAALGTFAVLIIVHEVVRNWESVTRGEGTMIGVPTDLGIVEALGWALVAIGSAYWFKESTMGLRLRASREDEIAAPSVGIDIARERRRAFVLSAFVMGVGGAMFAHFLGSFGPDAFFLKVTFVTLAMLVVGGMHSLSGAVIGTVVVSMILEGLRLIEAGVDIGPFRLMGRAGLREVGLGALMILILILRPRGITGGREIRWPFGQFSITPRPDREELGPHSATASEVGRDAVKRP